VIERRPQDRIFRAVPGMTAFERGDERLAIEHRREILGGDALVELGWSLPEAERALAGVDPDLPVEERVRLALREAA